MPNIEQPETTKILSEAKVYLQSLVQSEDLQPIARPPPKSITTSSKPKALYICIRDDEDGEFTSLINCHSGINDFNDFKYKYLKYKMKYLNLKLQKSS
jgi:hypothetical protein